MANNRASAEAFILKFMKDLDPSGYNVKKWETILSELTDKQFDEYMQGLRNSKEFLVCFKPPFEANGITIENNLKIAPKYKVKFFQKLDITNNKELPDHRTPIEYLVIDLPVRRQSQNLIKKINIPEHNKVVDQLSGQPTGDSKGAKISYPELQVLNSMGLEKSLEELIKFRGGDKGGFNAYNAMFLKYGTANLRTLNNYSSGVESTKTLRAYLMSMHIKPTL